jgi:hypothetical protein
MRLRWSNNRQSTKCDLHGALSGIPYNVFHGEPGNIYDKFCFYLDDSSVSFEWIVDAHGNKQPQSKKSARASKRTPPPNPKAYETFDFKLRWELSNKGDGCVQNVESCMAAFAKLANSQCGHQGGKRFFVI